MFRCILLSLTFISISAIADNSLFTIGTQNDDDAKSRISEILGDLKDAGSGELLTEEANLRADKIKTHAYHFGHAEGLYYQHNKNQSVLNKNATRLYQVADFSKFIVDGKLLLPTALKSSRVYEQLSETEARTVNLSITLDKPGEIVVAPPTWRDYLTRSVDKPYLPDQVLMPRDEAERYVFESAFTSGWKAGAEQANLIFDLDYRRLEQDLKGHYLFRQLAVQNVFRLPKIEQVSRNVVVSGDGRTMHVDDVIYRINAPEGFEDIDSWIPVFTQGETQ